MALKRFYQILSILSIVFGISLLLGTKIKIIGGITGMENIPVSINLIFGVFFLLSGTALFIVQHLDKKFNA